MIERASKVKNWQLRSGKWTKNYIQINIKYYIDYRTYEYYICIYYLERERQTEKKGETRTVRALTQFTKYSSKSKRRGRMSLPNDFSE